MWLFLGSASAKVNDYRSLFTEADRILVAGARPMDAQLTSPHAGGSFQVDLLGSETLSENDRKLVATMVSDQAEILRGLGEGLNYSDRPWWMFQLSYLSACMSQYASGKVALKNWLTRIAPAHAIIVRDPAPLTSAEFTDPVYARGPENVLAFVAEDECRRLGIRTTLIVDSPKVAGLQRILSVWLKGHLIAYTRLFRLPLMRIRRLLTFRSAKLPVGGVVFVIADERYVDSYQDLLHDCPPELSPTILHFRTPTGSVPPRTRLPVLSMDQFIRVSDALPGILRSATRWHAPVAEELRALRSEPIVGGFTAEYVRRIASHGRALAAYQKAAKRALKMLKPRLLIASDDSGPGTAAMVREAGARAIPTVSLQHAEYSPAVSFGADRPMIESIKLIRNRLTRADLIRRGLAADRILLYADADGSDPLAGASHSTPSLSRPRSVLVAGTVLEVEPLAEMVKTISEKLASSGADPSIRFRPHPVQRKKDEEYVRAFKSHEQIRVVKMGTTLSEQLAEASCALVFNSSVAFQIVVAGVPVVVYAGNSLTPIGFDHAAFVVTRTLDDAVASLTSYLDDELARTRFFQARREYLNELAVGRFAPDGGEWWPYLRQRLGI